jgi:intracellular sulfur oxidation DsrE/DsrF family protein
MNSMKTTAPNANVRFALLALFFSWSAPIALADEVTTYAPSRVVYDVSSADPATLSGILDRAVLLQDLWGNDPFESAIVVVIHEGAVPHFVQGEQKNAALVERARGLALGETIRFRLCRASARMQGFEDADFPDFIGMVPMADAEIVRLEHSGFAYLR